jgi:mRNA interferase RelE/StbE
LPELRITRRAREDLHSLSATTQAAVLETLATIAVEPESSGKQLLGRLEGLWSARVGNYRVPYTIEPNAVIVRAIRHRAVAYRRPRR